MANDDTLVVGAGPVGLVAAIELARFGRPVRVIDKEARRTKLSKAVGVNVQSLELLEPAGVTERLIAAGIRIRRADMWFDGRPLTSIDLSLVDHRYDFLLALAQSETERVLEEVLTERGVQVDRALALTTFSQTPDGVQAHLAPTDGAGETQLEVGCLLGADGARSLVRETLDIPFLGARYDEHWSLADVSLDWRYGYDSVNLFLFRNGAVLFCVPIATDRIRAISQTAEVLELLPAGSSVTEVHWESKFHVALRQAERYQQGRCFLAGDAAHVHSPAGGRGMNLGMWDACSFAARAAAGTLDGYSAERHPIGERILAFTDRLFRIAGLKNRAAQLMRNGAMRSLGSLPPVQRRIAPNLLGIER